MGDPEKSEKIELFELLLYAMDGRMSDAQFARLEELFSKKPDAIEDYVRFVMMYVALNQSQDTYMSALSSTTAGAHKIDRDLQRAIEHDEQAVVQSAAEEAAWQAKSREERIKTNAEVLFEKFKTEERRRQQELAYKQYRAQRRSLTCAVVSLTVLLTVVVFVWLLGLKSSPNKMILTPAPPPPPVVATVTNIYKAKGNRPDVFVVGAALTPGPLSLEAGVVEITFKSKATLILEAPAEVNLVTERFTRLSLGTVTAYVPRSAKGFQVETRSVCVTDLGTRFGMVVNERGVTDIHVFRGCVATSFETMRGNERDRIKTLYTNETMRFDAKADKAESIRTDLQQFALSWDDVLYKPHTNGPMTFERSMPKSLCKNSFESDSTIRLFREATNVALPHEMTVGITEPGTYRDFEKLSGTPPAGARVDSYLIHWDPASSEGEKKAIKGSVSFRRPILGLIVNAHRLFASDKLFGRPSVSYPTDMSDMSRHIESPSNAERADTADILVLSQDRRTLHVTLCASATDQLRILVEAAPVDEQ